VTLDTGALIALERRDRRIVSILSRARERGVRVTVPTPVIVEWWRGGDPSRWKLRREVMIEPLADRIAFVAGAALALVAPGPSPTDAVVMASAAQRGDVVLTSDVEDLEALRAVFPNVRVIRV
jgi:predicted nucleic acid-binding protein